MGLGLDDLTDDEDGPVTPRAPPMLEASSPSRTSPSRDTDPRERLRKSSSKSSFLKDVAAARAKMEQEVERLRREAMDAQAIAFDERQTLRRVFIKFMTPWVEETIQRRAIRAMRNSTLRRASNTWIANAAELKTERTKMRGVAMKIAQLRRFVAASPPPRATGAL